MQNLIILDTCIIDNNFISGIKNLENKIIIYLHATEFVGHPFNQNDHNKDVLISISDILKQNNSELYVVFGGHDCFRYEILKNINIEKLNFIFWPTFLLHYTYYMLKKKYDVIPSYNPSKLEKLFISFNQKPKQHRAIFIDLIHKNNLTNYGLYSWNELLNEWSNEYQFKYWNEKIVRLDIDRDRDILNVRSDYFTDFMFDNSCLFNIVGETMDNNDAMFITEKTYKPLIFGQPFICLGCPYQNLVLKNLGFRLYDGVIDYSFDQESNILDRVNGLLQNLEKLKFEDLNELYSTIKDTLDYNKNRAYEIIEKDNFIPVELIKIYKEFPESFEDFKNTNTYMDVGEYFCDIFK